jgi:hypothetical protein
MEIKRSGGELMIDSSSLVKTTAQQVRVERNSRSDHVARWRLEIKRSGSEES